MSAANQIYVLVGQDSSAKDEHLTRIKNELFTSTIQAFNCDTLFGPELSVVFLQERLAQLPLNVEKRLLVIKEAQGIKEEAKKYILKLEGRFPDSIVMVLISQKQI